MLSDKIRNYQEQSEALFREWKAKEPADCIDHRKHVFVSDGIVCPEHWFSQEVRPLFLLKEAHGKPSDCDLIRDHLMTNSVMKNHATWRRVTQWTYGLLNTTADKICPYREFSGKLSFGNAHLQQIAAVNIKKSDGKSKSDDGELLAYARYDREELNRQIQLIDPTVIVCGYTCRFLSEIVGTDLKQERNQNLFYTWRLNGHDVIVLDFWHPSNHYPDLMNYYSLMGIYQQALKQKARNS